MRLNPRHFTCAIYGVLGLTLAAAGMVHAADPVLLPAPSGVAPISGLEDPRIWIEIGKAYGLPGVMLLLFSRLPRLQIPIVLDEATAKALVSHVANLRRIRKVAEANAPTMPLGARTAGPDTRDDDDD